MPETREEACRRLLGNADYYEGLAIDIRLTVQLSRDNPPEVSGIIGRVRSQPDGSDARGRIAFHSTATDTEYRLTIDLPADEVKVFTVSGSVYKLGYATDIQTDRVTEP